jgi:hypothetical protein
MSEIWLKILGLLHQGELRVSEHGYDELAADGITVREIMAGISSAEVLEHYPLYPKGPCVLTIQKDREGRPIHVVWGISRANSPAVLVTAYRPDPERWGDDFRRRKK